MPDMQRLLSAIDAAEQDAYGSDSDGELADERSQAVDLYIGKNVEKAGEGRSQAQDRSVYETVQWIMPSLSRIYANGDDVVELPPVSREDEEPSKQEAQYLNYLVLQRNKWFETFDTAAKDALLTKAGYLYAYKDKRRTVEIERYERQSPDSLALIMEDEPDVIDYEEYPDPDAQPQVDPMTGMPAVDPMTGMPLPPPMLANISIRRTKEDQVFCIEALPPERCKIAETCKTVQVTRSPYFEYYDYPTISDLRQEGYEIDDDIADGTDGDSEEDQARDQYSEGAHSDENPADPSMRRIKCRWIWIRHDYDEDGIAELQYVVRVGQKILHREEVNRVPVGVICPDPLPHRHVGLCPADSVIEVQRIKTTILRQGLENLYLSNNPQKFANPSQVNLDDMLVSRAGGIIRTKGGVFGQDFGVLQVPFVFPQAMEGLEYMDQVRENRTGTNRYFTGIDQNALNKTATGIQQLSTMAAQRVEQIARHFSSGIEEMFSILHELVLKSGHKQEVVKLRGNWVTVDPGTWKSRKDFRMSVGYAAGNKDTMVSRLMLIAQMQEKAAAGGLPIVQPQNLYETAIELTKASDFSVPERFWTDPSQVPPPGPPQPDVTVVTAEEIRAKAQIQAKQIDVEQKERDSIRDVAIKKYQIDHQAVSQAADRQQDAKKEEQPQGRKSIKRGPDGRAQSIEMLDELGNVLASHQVIRAPDGSILGVQSEQKQSPPPMLKKLRRGPDGRAAGVDILDEQGNVVSSKNVVRTDDGRIGGIE